MTDDRCHLWFRLPGLPGYAWYVPKAGGYLNIGIGGYTHKMRSRDTDIRRQWKIFLEILQREGLVRGYEGRGKGYNYMIRSREVVMQKNGVMILGDAAGLATTDMGEGIGPALESGLQAARALAGGGRVTAHGIRRHSFSHAAMLMRLVWSMLTGRK